MSNENALITVAVPDSNMAALEQLIAQINNAKPADDERRAEDIIFAVGIQVMARYHPETLAALFKDRP